MPSICTCMWMHRVMGEVTRVTPTIVSLSQEIRTDIVCPIDGCERRLAQPSALRMHLVKTHKLIQNEQDSWLANSKRKAAIEENICYHCPEKSCIYFEKNGRHFTKYKYLKQHYMRVHGEKKYGCGSCKTSFALESDARRHRAGCGHVYSCLCGASYPSLSAVQTHCKRATKEKQHKYIPSDVETKKEIAKKQMPYVKRPKLSNERLPAGVYQLILPKTSSSQCALDAEELPRKVRPTMDVMVQTEFSALGLLSPLPVDTSTLTSGKKKVVAQTQTVGDRILKRAMEKARIPIMSRDVQTSVSQDPRQENKSKMTTRCLPAGENVTADDRTMWYSVFKHDSVNPNVTLNDNSTADNKSSTLGSENQWRHIADASSGIVDLDDRASNFNISRRAASRRHDSSINTSSMSLREDRTAILGYSESNVVFSGMQVERPPGACVSPCTGSFRGTSDAAVCTIKPTLDTLVCCETQTTDMAVNGETQTFGTLNYGQIKKRDDLVSGATQTTDIFAFGQTPDPPNNAQMQSFKTFGQTQTLNTLISGETQTLGLQTSNQTQTVEDSAFDEQLTYRTFGQTQTLDTAVCGETQTVDTQICGETQTEKTLTSGYTQTLDTFSCSQTQTLDDDAFLSSLDQLLPDAGQALDDLPWNLNDTQTQTMNDICQFLNDIETQTGNTSFMDLSHIQTQTGDDSLMDFTDIHTQTGETSFMDLSHIHTQTGDNYFMDLAHIHTQTGEESLMRFPPLRNGSSLLDFANIQTQTRDASLLDLTHIQTQTGNFSVLDLTHMHTQTGDLSLSGLTHIQTQTADVSVLDLTEIHTQTCKPIGELSSVCTQTCSDASTVGPANTVESEAQTLYPDFEDLMDSYTQTSWQNIESLVMNDFEMNVN